MRLCLLLLTLISFTHGWNYETHFIIGRIAYDSLKQRNPTALQRAEEVLRQYSDMVTVDNEKDYPLVESIIFADAIK